MAKKASTTLGIPEDSWQTECDLRTLTEAEAIEKDPKRLKAARELAKKKLLEYAAVASEGAGDEC